MSHQAGWRCLARSWLSKGQQRISQNDGCSRNCPWQRGHPLALLVQQTYVQLLKLFGIEDKSLDALTMLQALKEATLSFYSTLPDQPCYKGIVSETEAFMHELNKYKYLFTLCK